MAAIHIMEAAGLRYGIDFLIWSAHYTGIPHLCGPQCGFGLDRTVHNTQYTDRLDNRSLDGDLCTDLGVGIVTAIPDPNHYPRYDQTKRELFGGMSEEDLARKYDAERAKIVHFEPNHPLHVERNMCAQAEARLTHIISTEFVNGKEDPGLFYRGWRRDMFKMRADGKIATVK
jgi:hypothetical protein